MSASSNTFTKWADIHSCLEQCTDWWCHYDGEHFRITRVEKDKTDLTIVISTEGRTFPETIVVALRSIERVEKVEDEKVVLYFRGKEQGYINFVAKEELMEPDEYVVIE